MYTQHTTSTPGVNMQHDFQTQTRNLETLKKLNYFHWASFVKIALFTLERLTEFLLNILAKRQIRFFMVEVFCQKLPTIFSHLSVFEISAAKKPWVLKSKKLVYKTFLQNKHKYLYLNKKSIGAFD